MHSHLSEKRRFGRGISLVELLVVLAIILIVMGMIVAVLSKVYKVVQSFRS